jgi:anti-anti-sigma factor
MANWKNLKVDVQEVEDPQAVIYRVSGLLTDTSDAFRLLERIREDLEGPHPTFILDLSGVPHVTSAGVGILAAAYTSAKRTGKRIVLTAPASRVESLLRVVGLWELIEHFETVEAALGRG